MTFVCCKTKCTPLRSVRTSIEAPSGSFLNTALVRTKRKRMILKMEMAVDEGLVSWFGTASDIIKGFGQVSETYYNLAGDLVGNVLHQVQLYLEHTSRTPMRKETILLIKDIPLKLIG